MAWCGPEREASCVVAVGARRGWAGWGRVWRGRGSLGVLRSGWARFVTAAFGAAVKARPGRLWQGRVWPGSRGGACRGKAGLGMAGQSGLGGAGLGSAGLGSAGSYGVALSISGVCSDVEWHGSQGPVRNGWARRCSSGLGVVGHGSLGSAWSNEAGQVAAPVWRVWSLLGMAGRGSPGVGWQGGAGSVLAWQSGLGASWEGAAG